MNRAHRSRSGFTLIELMLSMTFISVLLIVIMLTVIQISRIYERGISMREVNQTGRSISSDLTRTIGSAQPFDLTDPNVFRATIGAGGRVVGGRLCASNATYVWNIGDSTVNGGDVRFVKIHDTTNQYCSTGAAVAGNANATDLLKGGERDLVMHNFTISRLTSGVDSTTGQALYAIRFIIGVKDTALLTSNNAACKPPSEAAGGEDYCAVNRFDLVVRAGNKELISENE